MDKLFEAVVKNTIQPLLRGRGAQVGGERISEEIIRVHPFSSNAAKAEGKELTVPADSLLVFSQGELDYLVFPLTIEAFPDPFRVIREARRVLREHGNLIILAVDGRGAEGPRMEGHLHAYDPAFLARIVELAGGFSIHALREVGETGLILLKAERDTRADVRIPFVTYTPNWIQAAQSPEGCAELFFQLGILHLQIGDLERAADSFQQVLAFEPECAEAMGGLGMAALCGDDPDGARAWFEKALARDPSNGDFRKWLELTLEAQKEGSKPEPTVSIPRPETRPTRPVTPPSPGPKPAPTSLLGQPMP